MEITCLGRSDDCYKLCDSVLHAQEVCVRFLIFSYLVAEFLYVVYDVVITLCFVPMFSRKPRNS